MTNPNKKALAIESRREPEQIKTLDNLIQDDPKTKLKIMLARIAGAYHGTGESIHINCKHDGNFADCSNAFCQRVNHDFMDAMKAVTA